MIRCRVGACPDLLYRTPNVGASIETFRFPSPVITCGFGRLMPALRQVWGFTKCASLFREIKSAIHLFTVLCAGRGAYALTARLFGIADLTWTFGLAFLGFALSCRYVCSLRLRRNGGSAPTRTAFAPLQGKTLLKKGYSLDSFLRLLVASRSLGTLSMIFTNYDLVDEFVYRHEQY